jgi:prolyl oligopeptidase PreP (S9A serine peptidase family)
VPDPYRWFEDQDSAEVAAWVTQNAAPARCSTPSGPEASERLRELWNRVRRLTRRANGGSSARTTVQNQAVLYVATTRARTAKCWIRTR